MKIIPVAASCAIHGFPSACLDYFQSELSLSDFLIQSPGSTFVAQGQGDELRAIGIFDGDWLVASASFEVRNFDVVIINYNGEYLCSQIDTINKRLFKIVNGQLVVTLEIQCFDSVELIGVVTSSIRFFRKLKK